MKRIKDDFLDTLETKVSLSGRRVLEIGCGDGRISRELSRRCRDLFAIEQDPDKLKIALGTVLHNAIFLHGFAEKLVFGDDQFDLVIFSLSLHHVSTDKMKAALDEAIRVVKPDGYVVIFEPGTEGSFFEAEIRFNACDGDERQAKRDADQAMMNHENLFMVSYLIDETVFRFDSLTDFKDSMTPKAKDLTGLVDFLGEHNYELTASRRICVFQTA